MPANHAELEIVLRWRRSDDTFDVGLAYDDPLDPQDRRDYVDEPLSIDTAALVDLVTDEQAYGQALGTLLLKIGKVHSFYRTALATASERSIPVHFRLVVDPRAPLRYHQIRWESIRDPDSGTRITTQRRILFSRYLSTPDWQSVRPPPWHRLKALVAIAAPTNVSTKHRVGMPDVPLDPVDAKAELRRARDALTGMSVRSLADTGRTTVNHLVEALDEDIDLLYLVCHGGIYNDVPRLYLEDGNGETAVVDGGVLVDRIGELSRPPTVVVLCSCQSAGRGDEALISAGRADEATTSDGGVLSALGPRLSGAGVSAVIAMQGNITMRTAELFFKTFFTELNRHGVVDEAMAVARGAVSDRDRDWWMPVLFTRLRLGRAWYEPEFGDSGDTTFRALIQSIKEPNCTPVLGSGIAGEGILPSREELAERWADLWLMPIERHYRGDLAKVAQYLSVRTAPRLTQTEVKLYLAKVLSDGRDEEVDVLRLISDAGERHRRDAPESDPYAILAGLRLPIYVTTSWTSLLEDAIRAAGRTPHIRHFRWNRQRIEEEDLPEPTRESPLVYHLFGTLKEPSSLVVTEDHYFAWLTAWIKRVDKDESIPRCVAEALTDSSLLFLGYRLDDWEFRVLFEAIRSFDGASLLKENYHVGVQVSPESTTVEPEALQEYLAECFGQDPRLSIYWGTCQRFLTDLRSRMDRARG